MRFFGATLLGLAGGGSVSQGCPPGQLARPGQGPQRGQGSSHSQFQNCLHFSIQLNVTQCHFHGKHPRQGTRQFALSLLPEQE